MTTHLRLLFIALLAPVLVGCASAPPPIDPDAFPEETWSTMHRPQGALMWKTSRFNNVTFTSGRLAGFDPNTCTLDAFGDAGVCTLMTTITLNVEPTLVEKRESHSGGTDRLFDLSMDDGPRLSVMFHTPRDAARASHAKLISRSEHGGIDSLINLHRTDTAPPAESPPEATGVIAQRWHSGYRPQRALFSERQINSFRIIPDGRGRCRFILDPNSCTLDAYGTTTACTRMSTQLVLSSYSQTDKRTLADGSIQERFEFQPDLGAIMPIAMIRTTHADGAVTAKMIAYTGDHADAVVQLLPGRGDK